MKITTTSAIVAFLALLAAGPLAAQKRPSSGVPVGHPFPVLKLPSLADGKPMSVADFRGHRVLLVTFASW